MVPPYPTNYVTLESLELYKPLLFYEQNEGRALITFKDHIQPGLTAGHHIFPCIPPEKEASLLPLVICFSLTLPIIKKFSLKSSAGMANRCQHECGPQWVELSTMFKNLLID